MIVVAGVGFVIGTVAVMTAAALWEGFVLSILWHWYAVGLFGLRALSVPEAIGVAVVIGLLTKQYVPSKDGDHAILWWVFIRPAVSLLIGWLCLKFI